MSSNCIYEIFKWMGIVMKYTGSIPLPGLYEWKGNVKVKSLLFSILLPLLLWIGCPLALLDLTYRGRRRNMERNLTDILACLIVILYVFYMLFLPPLFHFRTSSKLVNYLKLHARVDRLIKPHQNRLQLMANSLLIVSITINYTYAFLYCYSRFSARYNGEYMVYEMFAMFNYLYLVTCLFCQPQIMYVAFQFVLKSAFQELLKRIQEEKKVKNISVEDAKEKLKMYGTLYRSLCQMGKRLDDMTSPMIAHQFFLFFFVIIQSLSFSTFTLNLNALVSIVQCLPIVLVIVLLPMSAQETKSAASKIVSAAYSSFDLSDKEIAEEMQMFAAQVFQFKVEFSISGFLILDRNLILTVIQSIISQSVVFYKIQNV